MHGSVDMPHSAGITDPVGYVLAYIPVALALIAMVLAFLPATILLVLEVAARRPLHRPLRSPLRSRGEPAPELEARPAAT